MAEQALPHQGNKEHALPPLVVVGAGPVGQRFVEELRATAPGFQIKLFSGESWRPYDRVKLTQLLAHDISENQIYARVEDDDKLTIHNNCTIVAIDRQDQRVKDAQGHWHNYSRLILALGSEPRIPAIPNINCRNVFKFRDLNDTQALFARNMRSRHTVIIGGGLLGLEAARAMQRNATHVTVVQMGPHLMHQQLDHAAGAILEARMKAFGIEVICNARVVEVLTDDPHPNEPVPRVGSVRLDNGRTIDCDTVIVSAGIKPRIDLALQAGLAVGKGIRVNDRLQTSDPAIYAIGECVQFGEQLYGLVAPGWEHASIVAHQLAGKDTVYRGTINASTLKVAGEYVFSMGEVDASANASLTTAGFRGADQSSYRAIFTIHNRLAGALAIGNWPAQHRVRSCINEQRRVYFWNRLLFRYTGNLWLEDADENVSTWPASTVVCNCAGVTRGQLSAARARGATSVEALASCTRASTVCGSCKPLLAQFVGSPAAIAPAATLAWLKGLSLICCLLFAILLLQGPPVFSSSVGNIGIDRLWLDATAKQISGFSLLGLSLFSLLMSLSKRWPSFARLGKFTSWRIAHTALGVTALLVLYLHTGMSRGFNLNAWLMLDFVSLIAVGAMAGLFISMERKLGARTGKRIRSYLTWGHTLLFWPLPTLLGFHVVAVYYF